MPTDTKPPPAPTPITSAPKSKGKAKQQPSDLSPLEREAIALLDKIAGAMLGGTLLGTTAGVVAHLHTDELAALLNEHADVADKSGNLTRGAILRTLAKHLLPGQRFALHYSDLHSIMCDPYAIPGLPGFTRPEPVASEDGDIPGRVPFAEIVERQQRGEHVVGS